MTQCRLCNLSNISEGTVVGGGYINGSSEITYDAGFIWNQAPFGFSISIAIGEKEQLSYIIVHTKVFLLAGIFFAKRLRDANYVTMMDPFNAKYGRWGALHSITPILSEIFWAAAILSALGKTLGKDWH